MAGCEEKGHDKEGKGLLEKLLKSRTILLSESIDDEVASKVVQQLLVLEADDPAKDILLVLNSPGGGIYDGFAVFDMIKFVKPRVKILCSGCVASMGTIILLAVPREDRFALPNSRYMIHQPLVFGSSYRPAADVGIFAKEMITLRERINKILADGTGQPVEKIGRDTDRDYWMDAPRAVEYGLVSRIVEKREEIETA